MIRLIILAIGLFLLWLLFLSKFSKQHKIIYSASAITLLAVGVWFEGYGETPRFGLISNDQIVVCAATAEHSYRSNYNLSFCLQNESGFATAKRVELRFVAQDCNVDPCIELDAAIKQLGIDIAPGQQIQRTENLAFNALERLDLNLSWKIEVLSIKAVK